VPADGWYEWKRAQGGKVPHYFTHTGGDLLMFAGIWAPTGEGIGTCAAHHHRARPRRCAWRTWPNAGGAGSVVVGRLDGSRTHRAGPGIRRAVKALPAGELTAWPVSTGVNSVGNNGAELIERDGL